MKDIVIGVVDYGMGNLHSVEKALSLQGARVNVTETPSKLKQSDILVLPGVGSFGAAMKNLQKKNLDKFIREWLASGKPYMGICLGLQLLFESSEEDRGVPGLGALAGKVVRFQKKDFKKETYTIPHMGWNSAVPCHPERSNGSRKSRSFGLSPQDDIFKGISSKDSFYFVHTYYPQPNDKSVIATSTQYGKAFCSSVATKNIFACQFHPEKSGPVGLRLLSNVIKRMAA